ncbi:MAG TPA: hypothetical protein VMR62_30750 [Bryobacteraceae bacterium]|nr:hypothetical protein [Bryobacteraceae bacterium]
MLTAGKYWTPDGLEKEAQAYHEEAPEAVVTAVRQVVEETRGKK